MSFRFFGLQISLLSVRVVGVGVGMGMGVGVETGAGTGIGGTLSPGEVFGLSAPLLLSGISLVLEAFIELCASEELVVILDCLLGSSKM